jgi:hypothetical protein
VNKFRYDKPAKGRNDQGRQAKNLLRQLTNKMEDNQENVRHASTSYTKIRKKKSH